MDLSLGDKSLSPPNGQGKTPDTLERARLRSLVWPDQEDRDERNRKAYDVRFCRAFGTSAGLLLSGLVYLSDKGHDPEGWIFETKDGIQERFGLGSRYEVDQARKKLEDEGVLETTKRPRRALRKGKLVVISPSPVIHYKVKLAELAARLGLLVEPGGEKVEDASLNRGSKQSRVDHSSSARTRARIGEDEPLLISSDHSQMNTTEISPRGANAPRGSSNEVKKAFTLYCGMLEASGFFVSQEDRDRVPGNLKRVQENLRKGETIGAVIERMVEARRERGYDLSPQQALNDMRQGASGRKGRGHPGMMERKTKSRWDDDVDRWPNGKVRPARRTTTKVDDDEDVPSPREEEPVVPSPEREAARAKDEAVERRAKLVMRATRGDEEAMVELGWAAAPVEEPLPASVEDDQEQGPPEQEDPTPALSRPKRLLLMRHLVGLWVERSNLPELVRRHIEGEPEAPTAEEIVLRARELVDPDLPPDDVRDAVEAFLENTKIDGSGRAHR